MTRFVEGVRRIKDMMKRSMQVVVTVGLAVLVAVGVSGCATMFSGSDDNITIDSQPQGAKIMIDGFDKGRTPATFVLKRPGLDSKTVELQLAGYENRTFVLQKKLNTMAILNLGNIFGWIIDVLTGAVNKYDPTNYTIELQPKQSYKLDELEQDGQGRYIISEQLAGAMILDEVNGVTLIFSSQG